jgi:hypothetical protein
MGQCGAAPKPAPSRTLPNEDGGAGSPGRGGIAATPARAAEHLGTLLISRGLGEELVERVGPLQTMIEKNFKVAVG